MSETTKEKISKDPYERFRVNQSIFDKLERHLLALKSIDQTKHNKQTWLHSAIKEKIEETKRSDNLRVPRKRLISVKLDEKTKDDLNQQIKVIQTLTGEYSKHAWFVDAIEEKLARESQKVADFFKEKV